MKATRFEFRFRTVFGAVLYVIGFWAPWLRFMPSPITSMRLWSWLAIHSQHLQIGPVHDGVAAVSIQSDYLAITILAVFCAAFGAGLRLWGTAYLGRSVVFDRAMHAGEVMAAGPYRYMRNPLYLGSLLTALAVSILMPASGALFFLIALTIFVIRLALGEEAFLEASIGEAYVAYCQRVPRWLPSLLPRIPASGGAPNWLAALIGEVYPIGMALCFLALAWNYDAQLLTRCVLICFGASLVARAFVRPAAA